MKKHTLISAALATQFACSSDSTKQSDTSAVQDEVESYEAIETGLFSQTLFHDDVEREYLMYIPEAYNNASEVPLFLNFHGFGGTSESFMQWADMRPVADTENFILVYPQGTLLEGSPHWNNALPGDDNKSDADDFGFVEALIDELSDSFRVDTSRVYAAGYSNGSFFVYSMVCYHGDRIAAVGSVSGTMMEGLIGDCDPGHPTATINIHGTNDYVVPYDGGEGLEAIDDVLAHWASYNNTETSPTMNTSTDNGTTIEHYTYAGGDNGTTVEHLKLIGGEHVWFDMNYAGSSTGRLIYSYVSQYDTNGIR